VTAAGAPALASLGSVMWLAYQPKGGSGINVITNAGKGWAQGTAPSVTVSAPPALGVVSTSAGDVLCLAYLDGKSSSMNVLTWTGSKWSAPAGPGVAAAGPPAVAGFGEKLFLAQQSTGSRTIEIYLATSVAASGTAWPKTPIAVIQVDATDYTVSSDPSASPSGKSLVLSNPALAAYNGRLYLTFTDASQNVWICSSGDGASWSGFAELPQQVSGVQSAASAAVSALGTGTFALAYALQSNVGVLAGS
jgi:hypothetical protein